MLRVRLLNNNASEIQLFSIDWLIWSNMVVLLSNTTCHYMSLAQHYSNTCLSCWADLLLSLPALKSIITCCQAFCLLLNGHSITFLVFNDKYSVCYSAPAPLDALSHQPWNYLLVCCPSVHSPFIVLINVKSALDTCFNMIQKSANPKRGFWTAIFTSQGILILSGTNFAVCNRKAGSLLSEINVKKTSVEV